MPRFQLSDTPFDVAAKRAGLLDARVGAYAAFEGWVRDHNDGRVVQGLHYEAYARLAEAEGMRVIEEALAKFDIVDIPDDLKDKAADRAAVRILAKACRLKSTADLAGRGDNFAVKHFADI